MKVVSKILRVVAIILLGLTAAFTIAAGIGTICVALGAENYDSMVNIVPYKWLYMIFVVVTTAVGVAAVFATIGFARRKAWAFRGSLIILVLGILVGGVHMYFSQMLRGSSMPTDPVVYTTVLTLVVLLLLRIPGLWQFISGEQENGSSSGKPAAGLAAIVAGVATMTAPLWVTQSHTFDGRVWSRFFNLSFYQGDALIPVFALGAVMFITGVAWVVGFRLPRVRKQEAQPVQVESSAR